MIKLTDQEKQEIVRALDKNRPIPEKYRFLLFGEKRQVELLWNGKTEDICNAELPFQTIEQVDEPRAEKPEEVPHTDLFAVDNRGRQEAGWVNKLIWGDNKLILSSLKHGAMRKEIEEHGGIKLIYIDPPFDVGSDFSMKVEIGDDEIVKEPNILEEIAYRDTWGKGHDSFIAMIYERLQLMHDLLADDGSIYVHCDYRVSAYIRLIMDEIFGKDNFVNEIIWKYDGPQSPSKVKFATKHDMIFRYAKIINEVKAHELYHTEEEPFDPKKYKKDDDGNYFYTTPKGDYTDESIKRLDAEGKIAWSGNGKPRIKKIVAVSDDKKYFLKRKKIDDVWDITSLGLAAQSHENLQYPTQKPVALLDKIIKASSSEGDLVADFFCGSGTTVDVAEKLGRKWIAADLGKFAIHTTKKRMLGVQRELKKENKDYRAFEVLNLGKYEREHYLNLKHNLLGKEEYKKISQYNFDLLILKAYHAEHVGDFSMLQGKRNNRMVCIGYFNAPVDRSFIEELIKECNSNSITKVDVLGFEFEMGLFPAIQDHAKKQGIDLAIKHIPPEVFDKRAVENNEVVFYDVSYIDFKINNSKEGVIVELTDFSFAYSSDAISKSGGKVEIKNGKIFFNKTKDGKTETKMLTEDWRDCIDYWAVDFDFERKQEMIRIMGENGEVQEKWSGNYIFENEWQSFRTRQNRTLDLITPAHKCEKGKRKIAVRVVDIFGNDTMLTKEM